MSRTADFSSGWMKRYIRDHGGELWVVERLFVSG
jgi:hypothetical protein